MKRNNKITHSTFILLLVFCISIFLTSCKKDEVHEIRIVNLTNYHIDVFELNDNDHKYTFEVEAYDSTETKNIDLVTRCFCLTTGPFIKAGVEAFSDSTGNYSHTRGGVGKNTFEVGELNTIEITLADAPEFPGYVFDFRIRD